jgi:methionine aminotransferase
MGTTIFSVMSALATEAGAVNLGQGFPDFECDPLLVQKVTQAMQEGLNQYPPMPGALPLREAVSQKVEKLYGKRYDAQTEITVTAGATQAILTILLAIVHPGDEVIVLEPCYDSYVPNVEMAGGVVVRVKLTPGTFRPDFDKIQAAITPKTRAILINSPHNPSGMVWRHEDMLKLQEILTPTQVLLISDEVYEHMVYAPLKHLSASSYPGLAARAFVVSSFGKTYHVTGWKSRHSACACSLDHRVSQGSSIQCVYGQHPSSTCVGQVHARPTPVPRPASVLPAQTRLVQRRLVEDPVQIVAR